MKLLVIASFCAIILSSCAHIKWTSGHTFVEAETLPKAEPLIPIRVTKGASFPPDGSDWESFRSRLLRRNFIEKKEAPWEFKVTFETRNVPENGGVVGGILLGISTLSLGFIPIYQYGRETCTVEVYHCNSRFKTYSFTQKEQALYSTLLLPLALFTGFRSESMQLDIFEPKTNMLCDLSFEQAFLADYHTMKFEQSCRRESGMK